jgi:TolA-binding protein
MAEKEPVSLDALNGLLRERQRYEEWLAALEAKRASTSESVYQRVQADYQTRLREVSGKLAERAGELRENIDGLTQKLEEVTRQENQQREARQEAELRAAVGEYTDKQWKEIGGAWDKELGRLVKEKSALDAQLSELNRIFALSVKEKQSAAAMERSGPHSASAAPVDRSSGQDGNRAPISPVVPRPAIPEPPTLNPPSRTEPPPAARAQTPAPGSPTGSSRSPFDQFPVLRPNTAPGSPPAGTTAVATPPSVPKSGGAQDPRSEQHKTLKCPECGAANYPTEWYCERCGGELATM